MNLKQTISNGIKKRIAITPETWKRFFPLFKALPRLAPYSGIPVIGPALRRMTMIAPADKCLTQSYVLNLNEDVTERAQGTVMPIDMMKQLVRESTYLVVLDKCMCRTANGCKDFPHDIACIFIGEGSRVAVKNGVGHEASVEEVLAHIDKAAEVGLIGHALWIEIEQYVWGIKDEEMQNWMELCFCCPCCCSALKLASCKELKQITPIFRSIGWKASVDAEECTDCLGCVMRCPVEAISVKHNKVSIDEDTCLGCGFCAARCPRGAIKLNLADPIKGTIQDYFEDGGLRLDL